MGKHIHLIPHTLKDRIVLDCIASLNCLRTESRLPLHVTGGFGVQSYLPEEAYRKTVDLDFDMLWAGDTEEFRDVTAPLVRFLAGAGYTADFKRSGLSLDYHLSKKKDSLLIQHQRRSRKHFERRKKAFLEREMANQRIVSKGGLSYPVIAPEDIVARKLSRIVTFARSYGLNLPFHLATERLREYADSLRTDILQKLGNVYPEEVAKMRSIYDCFDIKCLADYVGLNRRYFDEVAREWKEELGKDESAFNGTLNRLNVVLD